MKITFFKNESHFYSRISYVWENAEKVNYVPEFQRTSKVFSWLLCIPAFIFAILFAQQIINNYLLFIGILIFALPVHELCHAVFCLISGRKVDRICFFPYKNFLTSKTAYVMPAFGAWNKCQAILFSAFPIILLTILPAFLAIFIPRFKLWLIFLSLLNVGMSHFDIIDVISLFQLPKNCIYFGTFSLIAKDNNTPVVIHRLSITPELDSVCHRQYTYFQGRMTEDNCAVETPDTKQLKQEFIKQFDLKE